MTREEIVKQLHKVLNAVDITFPYRLELINAIEYLLGPPLPSNLDEAAEEYATIKITHTHGEIRSVEKYEAFKAGAEWDVNSPAYCAIKKVLAIGFMLTLDEIRPEDKMFLSNGECMDIEKAFDQQDWERLERYLKKYSPVTM